MLRCEQILLGHFARDLRNGRAGEDMGFTAIGHRDAVVETIRVVACRLGIVCLFRVALT
jgi:hypothetical protein